MNKNEFYGQKEKIAEILKHLRGGRSVALSGDKGTGKSAAAYELNRRISNEGKWCVAYIPLITSRKPFHQDFLCQLGRYVETLPETQIYATNTNVNTLLAETHRATGQLKKCICIIETESLSPVLRQDILKLMRQGVLFVIASKSAIHKEMDGQLERVRLELLKEDDAKIWIAAALAEKEVEDKAFAAEWLVSKSGGHPGAISETLSQWEEESFLTKDTIEKTTVRKTVRQRHLYLPVSIICVTSFFINRYTSRLMLGGGDRIEYLIGAVGWILAVTYLVFFFGALKKSTAITDGTPG